MEITAHNGQAACCRRRNLTIWLLILGGAGLALVAMLFWTFWAHPAEPVYRGVGLSAWLDGSMVQKGGSGREMREILDSAGPEALPWLAWTLERYEGQRGTLYWGYVRFLQRSPAARSFLPSPPGPRWEIERDNAIGLLARLAPGTSYEAKVANSLVRIRVRAYDREAQQLRLYALGCCTDSGDTVIPALLEAVTNVSPAITDISIEGFRKFKVSATPILYRMSLAETGFYSPWEVALEEVDKDAYVRLQSAKHR